jgi:FkbM family methyltransferase
MTTDNFIINEIFGKDEYKLKAEFVIKPNDVVVDVGAQIGIFSLYCASKGANVYAYEPMKPNYKLLLKNKGNNKFNNIHAFNLGLSSKKEVLRLFLSTNSGGHSIFNKSSHYQLITCITLKDVIDSNNLETIDLLKIDCEGAEYQILFSTSTECFNKIKAMIIEYHEFPSITFKAKDIKEFLTKLNFMIQEKKYENQPAGILYVKAKK